MIPAEPAGLGTAGAGPQLLLVEDEESIGSLVRAYLEQSGFRVAWVRSGEDALASSTGFGRAWSSSTSACPDRTASMSAAASAPARACRS